MDSGLAVSVAIDSTLYQTHVFAADMTVRSHKRHAGHSTTTWGHKPVLLLLGIRLGIDGVSRQIFFYHRLSTLTHHHR